MLCRLLLPLLALPLLTAAEGWRPLAIEPRPVAVSPGCGLVLWSDSDHAASDAVQLEFSYLRYDAVATDPDPERWDWSPVEALLASAAAHRHQLILRPYFDYPDQPVAAVPAWIRSQPGYRDLRAQSEGKPTGFCDWSSPALQAFALDFHRRMAQRYDRDPRLAMVQLGFGLWAEYHIYDGPFELGKTFPDHVYQARFLRAMPEAWRQTPWLISIDAAEPELAPIVRDPALLALGFGCFDDSFLAKEHPKVNAVRWAAIAAERWQRAPAGGEFSYYNKRDQKLALSAEGPHGDPFPAAAARFHLSFIIADDQPRQAGLEAVRAAGALLGYRFRIARADSDGVHTRVEVVNDGIAPPYQDCWPALGTVRSATSLRGLLPGASRSCEIAAAQGAFAIACDRLVPGQVIGYTVGERR
jgi:hypothetical protein